MDLYPPAFPELASGLDASQAEVQLTLTADLVGLVSSSVAAVVLLGPARR